MELLQLKYFFESAKTESFAKTAEKFMVPTSSVSASVKRLENELGCSLFDRMSNRIVLNSKGKRLKSSLTLVFSELEGAVESISAPKGDTREVKMLVRSIRKEITSYIVEYNAGHPDIRFKTVFDFSEKDIDSYDIIIDEKKESYSDWESFPLCSFKVKVAASADSPLCKRKHTLASLKNEHFVSFGEQSNTHRMLVNACDRAGFLPNIAVQCNDIDCHEKLIEFGIGIGIGFDYDKKPQSGKVAFLDVTDFNERYDVYCYYRKSAYYGNVKHFLDFLLRKSL
ncbi:MAG: LysR family transcriptional regulator [Clostridia bacterium]|nr:LysR family transcriptional regulator [Clostridia bacterium]